MADAREATFGEVRNALKNEYDRVVNKVESEGSSFLEQPSYCSEWQVYQVVSHLGSGAEIFLRSLEAALDGKEALSNEGRQAIWDHFNALGPQDVYREARDRLDKLFAYLDALPAEKHNAIVPTFAGELPLPRALLTRLNEMALHSWDLYAKKDPKAKLDAASAELLLDMVIDRLPNRAKQDGLNELHGQPVGFDIQNGGSRQFTLRPGAERASIERGLPSNPLFTVKLTAEGFERLVAGRLPIERAVTSGDARVSANTTNMRSYPALDRIFPGY